MTRQLNILIASVLFTALAEAHAQENTQRTASPPMASIPPARWTFALTPYVWLPSVDGTLRYSRASDAGSPSVSVDEDAFWDALDFAFMLAGEARRGRWSLHADYIYLKFFNADSAVRSVDFNAGSPVNLFETTVDTGTESSLKGYLLSLAVGYRAVEIPALELDAIAGLRYLHVSAKTDWRLSAAVAGPGPGQTFDAMGDISDGEDLVDAIIGARGRLKLSERWFVPYHFDLGRGSSKLTWQALAGIGYAFRWGDVSLAYRHLEYEQEDDKLLQDFEFSGPLLSARFRF